MRPGIAVLVLLLLLPAFGKAVKAAEEDWVVGTWRQLYDPHDEEIDYLEFLANGDVISRSSIGEYRGFYIVAPGVVKAVLSVGSKDLILTFFHNEAKNQLRIVTSETGIETVYEKVEPE
jgi:hypothetical protein